MRPLTKYATTNLLAPLTKEGHPVYFYTMKRLIIILLAISTLSTSFAWALDIDLLTSNDNVVGDNFVSDSDGNDSHDGLVMDCHFCDCGLAHIAGLFSSVSSMDVPQANNLVIANPSAVASHITIPPARPPRA